MRSPGMYFPMQDCGAQQVSGTRYSSAGAFQTYVGVTHIVLHTLVVRTSPEQEALLGCELLLLECKPLLEWEALRDCV